MLMKNHSIFFSRLIKPVASSYSLGKVFHGHPLIGMLKRYHDIPPYVENREERENRDETEPFSLVTPRTRRNLVYDRWRNVSFDPQVLGPGMILFKNYVTLLGQADIVHICQKGTTVPGGFYEPRDPSGATLGIHMMCYGRNWDPVTRYEKRYRSDGSEPPPLPYELISLAEITIQDAQKHLGELPSMCPDICLARFLSFSSLYRFSVHQDCDESSDTLARGLPVVSVTIGDSVDFMYCHNKDEGFINVLLESGDVLIHGAKSRLIFQKIGGILSHSTPCQLKNETKLRHGNLSLTLKQF